MGKFKLKYRYFVVEGLVSSYMNMPTCVLSAYTLTISKFTSVILNNLVSKYLIKVQIQHGSNSVNINSYYYKVKLHAHNTAISTGYTDHYVIGCDKSESPRYRIYSANYGPSNCLKS